VNQDQLAFFEELLRQEWARVRGELGALATDRSRTPRESTGELSGYSMHMADQASDNEVWEKSFYFSDVGGKELAEIEEALDRLRHGRYGLCQACEAPIAPERLEARPQARFCIDCQERAERGEALSH
jgi:DnaK suppressor protein